MEIPELKRQLIRLIGDCIDEQTLPDCNSFIEMDQAVVHFAGDGGDLYFRVTLTQTTEDEYFEPYDPERDEVAKFRTLLQEAYNEGEKAERCDTFLHERIRIALGLPL